MSPVRFEMTKRLAQIKDKHKGEIVYLLPSLHLDCGKLVHTGWWYKWAGFEHTEELNRWQIPE